MVTSPEADFLSLSRRIGVDPMLVQGPGGNSSVKQGDTMLIKASGTELADAGNKEIFVAVDRAAVLAELRGQTAKAKPAPQQGKAALRPSIETTFHALLPQTFVFHYHSVRSICYSACAAGRAALPDRLAKVAAHVSVPYQMPGVPLTHAIDNALPQSGCDLIVLANHGLIVAGASVDYVADLIDQVERSLALEASERPAPATPADVPGWQWVADSAGLGVDARLRELATQGSYYPDHVVFLGPALPCVELAQLASEPLDGFEHPAVIVDGLGVCIKAEATAAQRAMLQCLTDFLYHLPRDWHPEPIGVEAEASLLDWDAEKYRQALSRREELA